MERKLRVIDHHTGVIKFWGPGPQIHQSQRESTAWFRALLRSPTKSTVDVLVDWSCFLVFFWLVTFVLLFSSAFFLHCLASSSLLFCSFASSRSLLLCSSLLAYFFFLDSLRFLLFNCSQHSVIIRAVALLFRPGFLFLLVCAVG